jgi:stearoyl-CoA desaturase (delta-9 desaturase)
MAETTTRTAEPAVSLPTGVSELDAGAIIAPKTRKTLSNPYLHRLQRRHFLLFDILPIAEQVLKQAQPQA